MGSTAKRERDHTQKKRKRGRRENKKLRGRVFNRVYHRKRPKTTKAHKPRQGRKTRASCRTKAERRGQTQRERAWRETNKQEPKAVIECRSQAFACGRSDTLQYHMACNTCTLLVYATIILYCTSEDRQRKYIGNAAAVAAEHGCTFSAFFAMCVFYSCCVCGLKLPFFFQVFADCGWSTPSAKAGVPRASTPVAFP